MFEKMKIETKVIDSNSVYVIIEGIIDTNSAVYFGETVEDAHNRYPQAKITLDFTKVEYITSACIRYLLSFVKANYNIVLTGVRKEVNTILRLTGLDCILDIEQEVISLDVKNCKLLGKGFHSAVYKIDDDKIAKIYFDIKDLDMLINERIIAKQAFIKGVPTEISYGMCEADGKPGLIYELVDADTLISILKNNPDDMDKYIEGYVNLVKEFHKYDSKGFVEVPDYKLILRSDIKDLIPYYSKEEINKMNMVLDEIPDSINLLHGDIHPGNVMVTSKGMIFIDLSDTRYGYGDLDLVYLNRTLVQFTKLDDNHYDLPDAQAHKLWGLFFNEYFKDLNEEEKKAKHKQIETLALISITSRFIRKDPQANRSKIMLKELSEMINIIGQGEVNE